MFVSFLQSGYPQQLTRINFDKLVHDFGQIKEEDGLVTCKFVFENIGKKPLYIKEVKSTCGCTTPSWTKEPVKPGKTGFIAVVFDPKNRKDFFNKIITVTANTTPDKTYLKITGFIIPRPHTVLDDYPVIIGNLRFKAKHVAFKKISSLSIDTGYIEVYNPGERRVRIDRIESTQYILYDNIPVSVFPKTRVIIPIIYNAMLKNELGYVHNVITLKTDDNLQPDKTINVVANIEQDFSRMTEAELENMAKIVFEETEHDFGIVKKGDVVEHTFKFRNEGKYMLMIYVVNTSCGCTAGIVGNRKVEPGETGYIKAKFNTSSKKGPITNTLAVLSNDPKNPQVDLKVKANVVVVTNQ